MDKLIGYGVAYSGVGHTGCYELEVKFGSPMEFVIKLDLQVYFQPTSAACINHSLDFFEGMNT